MTRRYFLCAGGAWVGMAFLAACTSLTIPAADTAGLGDGSGQETTGTLPAGTATEPPPQRAETITPSSGVTESTVINAQAQDFAQQSIQLVNQARSEAGLEPLTTNPLLGEVAMDYSRRMATEGFYGHEDPQGREASDRIAEAGYLAQMSAENIASGQPDPATVVEGWLNSPGHRANIMNPDLREIGAGYAYTETPPYHHFWTHLFATPDASVGRDRARYPALALAQINELRAQAGVEPLTMHPTLEGIATSHVDALVQAGADRSQTEQILNEAGSEAVQSFQQAVALSAAGAATPEEVVAQWVEENGSRRFIDASLHTAGVAYRFVAQDAYRHYWLVLLGS